MKALVAAGVAGLVILLSGCGGDQTGPGPQEKAQDTLNHDTPVWTCILNGGTWNGPTDGGSCKR